MRDNILRPTTVKIFGLYRFASRSFGSVQIEMWHTAQEIIDPVKQRSKRGRRNGCFSRV